ncbi:MFS transporter [Microterricola viridarii]|uniref:Sugar phosphate permease n=1 Tax=Microterricola viridarii TaxID=412690 RepID=A0A1H1YCU6_9MICO|nr:MFS transporter [Microterricola viridarii]SDT19109.1 Sugar phosphate permease [Microterricola viridarii]
MTTPDDTTLSEVAPAPVRALPASLGARRWFAVVIVGLVGQIAWTLENMYLNVFVYDTITDDPNVLAAMVAASAIAATLATLLVGAISDRIGKRRLFIVAGYLLWGLSTAAFGFVSVDGIGRLVPVIDAVALTVLIVILLDCVMSFIGSSANDAAFNAWVTDVTSVGNRAKVESVLAALPLLSMLIVFGALDGFTRAGQWREFFGIIGVATMLVGVLAWFLIRDVPNPARQSDRVFRSIAHGLRPSVVRANPRLYLALAAWAVFGISTQVFLPYLIIYIQRTLRIQEYALVLGVVLLGAAVVSVLGGRVIDRVGTVRSILPIAAIYVLGLVLMSLARDTVFVIVAGLFMMSGFMLMVAAIGASVRNFSPVDRVGSVQGLRMIFAILVPMLIGPFIGAAVISGAGETYEELGVAKQVPTGGIFVAAAIVTLFVLVPALALQRRERTRSREPEFERGRAR